MRGLAAVLILVLAGTVGARDIVLADVLLPGENWREVKGLPGAPAALAADGAGNVLAADAGGKGIWKVTDGKAALFAKTSSAVGGLAFAGGRLYAALPDRQQIVRYDEKGNEEVVHDRTAAGDLIVRGKRVYYTAPGKKAVYLAGHSESVAKAAAEPAGLALWNDGNTLVVGDAAGAHLYAYRIGKDGALDAGERYYPLFARPGKSAGVRGLAVDSENLVYAATAEGVQVFDPTGRLFGVLARPARAAVTAVTFGGVGRKSLFIVCGGKLWQRKMKARGAALAGSVRP